MAKRDPQHGAKRNTELGGKEQPSKSRMHPWMYIFSVVILVIIVVTFIGGPLVGGTAGGGGIVFGSYDGEDIEFYPGNYLSRQRDSIAERIAQSGMNTNLEWIAYQVWRSAYQNTVVHTAILKKAEQSGLQIPDEVIDQALTAYPGYQENGEFSPSRYRDTSRTEKASIRKYYREELISSQVRSDLLDGVNTSSQAIQFIKEMATPERSFFYSRIGFSSFPDEMVWNYAEENADLFRKINLSRITIQNSEESAKTVHQQLLADPGLFDEVARNQSKDAYAENGGYIGQQYFFSLSTELESEEKAKRIFSLSQGSISEIMTTPFGWVIYKCNEDPVAADRTNEEDIDTVRSYMERFEKGTIEDYLIEQGQELRDRVTESGLNGLEARGWENGETASFPLNYGNVEIFKRIRDADRDSGSFENAAFNESFLEALFSLKPESISEPLVLNNMVYLFELKEEAGISEDNLSMLESYYPYLGRQYSEADMQSLILSSAKHKDNFDAVFSRYFISGE
jgi:parvulin-like peptidyl-prolyl isomerase